MSQFKRIAAMNEQAVEGLQVEGVKIYEKSFADQGNSKLLMVKDDNKIYILAAGTGDLYDAMLDETLREHYEARYFLADHEDTYEQALINHTGKHLERLGK